MHVDDARKLDGIIGIERRRYNHHHHHHRCLHHQINPLNINNKVSHQLKHFSFTSISSYHIIVSYTS